MHRPIAVCCALLAVVAGALRAQVTSAATAPRSVPAPAEALLDRLVGDWSMVGQVRGRPVRYVLAARRVLAGRYIELHMTDVNQPPQYEARVFVGADTVAGRILVHWLDSFGATFSVPHGVGAIVGDTLQFQFAYTTGPFRDTFIYHGPARRWTFRLEAGDGRGGWRLFATYDVRPTERAPAR
jgi:hypothetical protein